MNTLLLVIISIILFLIDIYCIKMIFRVNEEPFDTSKLNSNHFYHEKTLIEYIEEMEK